MARFHLSDWDNGFVWASFMAPLVWSEYSWPSAIVMAFTSAIIAALVCSIMNRMLKL